MLEALSRWLQQAVLFAHLIAFAIAVATVLHEDLKLLRRPVVDGARLARAARIVGHSLAALWATGVVLIVFEVGFDLHALLERPKLVAKLVVVVVLTLNGVALHRVAFPRLRAGPHAPGLALAFVLGAVSSASWLAAAFIGVARLVAPLLGLADFLMLYATLVATAVSVALVLFATRPRIPLRLHSSR